MENTPAPLRHLFPAGHCYAFITLLVIFFLAGACIITPPQVQAAEEVAAGELPENVQLAITGIVMRMRNIKTDSIPGLVFAPGADKLVMEDDFHYPGFNITRMDILSTTPEGTNAPGGVTGIFTFRDNFTRGAEAFFSANYHTDVERKIFVIDKAVVVPRNVEKPRLELFVLPLMKFVNIMKGEKSHAELLQQVSQNAIDTTPGKPLPSGKGHYAFCFFFLDRLPEEPLIHIQPQNIFFDGPGNIKPTIEEHNFLGWRVPVIKCTADLTANPPVTLDVRYSATDLSQATSDIDPAALTHIAHYTIPARKKHLARNSNSRVTPMTVEKEEHTSRPQPREAASQPQVQARMEKIWWTGVGGERNGPFTLAEITAQAKENTITSETLVWCKGMDNWQPAGKVASLKALFAELPPPLPGQ